MSFSIKFKHFSRVQLLAILVIFICAQSKFLNAVPIFKQRLEDKDMMGEFLAGENEENSDGDFSHLNDLIAEILRDRQNHHQLQLQDNNEEEELSRPARERKQIIEKYRKMLQGLIRKGSLYNTLPIDAEVFDQYMANYLDNYGAVKRFSLNSVRREQKIKKAACGNLSGNPMHKWICW